MHTVSEDISPSKKDNDKMSKTFKQISGMYRDLSKKGILQVNTTVFPA